MAVKLQAPDDTILWEIALRVTSTDHCMGLAVFLLQGISPGGGAAFLDKWERTETGPVVVYNVLVKWCRGAGQRATGAALYSVLRKNEMNDIAKDFRARLLGGEDHVSYLREAPV